MGLLVNWKLYWGLCTGLCIGDSGLDHWLLLLSFPFRSLHFISFHFLTTVLFLYSKTLEMKGAKMNRK